MAKLGDFIAFQAAVGLLEDNGKISLIDEVYQLCKSAEEKGSLKDENFVKKIYEPFTDEEISKKIGPAGANFEEFSQKSAPAGPSFGITILAGTQIPRRRMVTKTIT